jgi:hypothetical protein
MKPENRLNSWRFGDKQEVSKPWFTLRYHLSYLEGTYISTLEVVATFAWTVSPTFSRTGTARTPRAALG